MMSSGQELYNVEDFWKFKLQVGLVKEASRVPRTRKLIKLKVDFGVFETSIRKLQKDRTPRTADSMPHRTASVELKVIRDVISHFHAKDQALAYGVRDCHFVRVYPYILDL